MRGGPGIVPPYTIPLSFFGVALLDLGGGLVWMLVGSPALLAFLHLLVLGVFAIVAMGALYQFVPVVGMAPLRWKKTPFFHLGLAVLGTSCVVYGMQTGHFSVVAFGGISHAVGMCMQAANLFAIVRGSVAVPARFAGIALAWLVATAVSGVLLAFAFARGDVPQRLTGIHPILGLAGFFGTLITAVSFRLLRMFERVDEEPRTATRVVGVGVAAAIAFVWSRAGGIALSAAAVILLLDVLDVARRRNPAYQRETLWYSCTSFAGALAAAMSFALGDTLLSVTIAVWFFIGAAVAGYLQRIVPFIWWIERSRRSGPKNIPALKDMNSSPLGYAVLALWIAAGAAWLCSVPLVATLLALAAWAALIAQLSRPFRLTNVG